MSYIHKLPEQMRIDDALLQYTARRFGIVDYHIYPIIVNGQYYHLSKVERCPACGEPADTMIQLIEHYETIPHIAEMYQLSEHVLEKQLDGNRHVAIRYIVNMYRDKTTRPLSSLASVRSVLQEVRSNLKRNIHKLTLPQLEELVAVLQLHVPDYYEETKEFWAMQLLATQ